MVLISDVGLLRNLLSDMLCRTCFWLFASDIHRILLSVIGLSVDLIANFAGSFDLSALISDIHRLRQAREML